MTFVDLKKYKTILWDFDGVLMDSMPIRDKGFEIVLEYYPHQQVEQLLAFHKENGGLSRYVKFRYFFEVIRNESVTDERVQELAKKFSYVMLQKLLNPKLLIDDSCNFVRTYGHKFNMHIVSGSDGDELNHICKELELSGYFRSIHGSPTPKDRLVQDLLDQNKYSKADTILIGDSINDFDAATKNGIAFCGYNNLKLMGKCSTYISTFNSVRF